MNYDELANTQTVQETVQNLRSNNFEPIILATKEETLEKIKELIPNGASVMNGSSKTLQEIGYTDYLKAGEHGWNNLHALVLAEKDPAKQAVLRKQVTISDFYLGSVHALTQQGELLIASNTGSQLPGIVFNATNLIFVVGIQKIVKDLPTALERLNKHVIPLEDERMKGIYGYGTTHAKTVILHKENPNLGRKIWVLLVQEKLGF